jgi:formylglycine-generating enzyme required for sulfatase activity
VPVEYTNSVGVTFRLIPAGEFLMGSSDQQMAELLEEAVERNWPDVYQRRLFSEVPQHPVRITAPFYISIHEITQEQYRRVTIPASGDEVSEPGHENELALPLASVSWRECIEFCNALSRSEKREPLYRIDEDTISLADRAGYRLPTEAEWEYACRAGTETTYHFGDSQANLDQFAVWLDQAAPQRVAARRPNAFQLHDMHGNVAEWCFDRHDLRGYSRQRQVDPVGPPAGIDRVIRGGSWSHQFQVCRSAHRYHAHPKARHPAVGFRIVLTLDVEE